MKPNTAKEALIRLCSLAACHSPLLEAEFKGIDYHSGGSISKAFGGSHESQELMNCACGGMIALHGKKEGQSITKFSYYL